MSFILDALKKSENERQRADAPALYEMKMAPPRRGVAVWLVVLAGLLVINVIVLSVVLLRGNHSAVPQPEANTAAPAAPTAAPAPAAATALTTPAPSYAPAQTAPLPSPPAMTATAPPPAPAPAADTAPAGNPADDAPAVEPPRTAAGAANPSAQNRNGGTSESTDVPSYQQVAGVPGSNLPDLKLDLHAYAANPADRFVFLNMTKLREGQSTSTGVRVESITPDGAILSWQGSRFFLQRQ
jgi:general secretion pathway protein B